MAALLCREPPAVILLQKESQKCMQAEKECVVKAVEARNWSYEEALRHLQEGRGLLQQCGQQSPLQANRQGVTLTKEKREVLTQLCDNYFSYEELPKNELY